MSTNAIFWGTYYTLRILYARHHFYCHGWCMYHYIGWAGYSGTGHAALAFMVTVHGGNK